jgi:hypothetical protein
VEDGGMTDEELKDWMALVHKRLTMIKRNNRGEWPSGRGIDFTPEEVQAILSALEVAGAL